MKKQFFYFVILASIIQLITSCDGNDKGLPRHNGYVVYGQFYLSVSGTEATVVQYNGNESSVVIPETVQDYIDDVPVTYTIRVIGSNAFLNCTTLQEIEIPYSTSSIAQNAFKGCGALRYVNWKAKSCADFSYSTSPFSNSTQISSFMFGNDVERIPSYLCNRLHNLKSVTFPNSLKEIGEMAFYGCAGLNSLEIPSSVTNIGKSAFLDCGGLHSLTIGQSVKEIGPGAFANCFSLETVNWKAKSCSDFSGVESAPFNSMRNINNFIFGDEVETIPAYLCNNLLGLTSVTIPNSVTTIKDYAFYNAIELKSITFGNNLKLIKYYAFGGCSNLKTIKFKGQTPPTISGSSLASYPIHTVIYVPTVSLQSYKDAFNGQIAYDCTIEGY